MKKHEELNPKNRHEKIYTFLRDLHKQHQEDNKQPLKLSFTQQRNIVDLASYVDAYVRENYLLKEEYSSIFIRLIIYKQKLKHRFCSFRRWIAP